MKTASKKQSSTKIQGTRALPVEDVLSVIELVSRAGGDNESFFNSYFHLKGYDWYAGMVVMSAVERDDHKGCAMPSELRRDVARLLIELTQACWPASVDEDDRHTALLAKACQIVCLGSSLDDHHRFEALGMVEYHDDGDSYAVGAAGAVLRAALDVAEVDCGNDGSGAESSLARAAVRLVREVHAHALMYDAEGNDRPSIQPAATTLEFDANNIIRRECEEEAFATIEALVLRLQDGLSKRNSRKAG